MPREKKARLVAKGYLHGIYPINFCFLFFFFYIYFADINIESPSTKFKVTWVQSGFFFHDTSQLNSLQVIRDLKIYHKEYHCKSISRIYISYFISSLETLQYHISFHSIKVLCLFEETYRYITLPIGTFLQFDIS